MDRNTHFIERLYQASDEELVAWSRQRMLGELGPAVDYNESWGELLITAYNQAGDPPYQTRFKQCLVRQLLPAFATDFVALGADTHGDWQCTVTALQVAARIRWEAQETALTDLQGRIQSWLTGLQRMSGALPLPRERVALGTGFPQTDLISALFCLVAEVIPWSRELVGKLWELCAADHPHVDARLCARTQAERYWWLAYWALSRDSARAPWLAAQVDQLSRALEAADWWPGNLTCLFLRVETRLGSQERKGQERIANLIQNIPYPQSLARRKQLAAQLYYFDEHNRAIREQNLLSLYQETSQEGKRPDEMIIFSASVLTAKESVQQAAWHVHSMATHQQIDPQAGFVNLDQFMSQASAES
ncbi:MAG: hypothetical protein AAFP10_03895 [Pseudomonadota bacterium]